MPEQHSTSTGHGWDQDPEHSPEAMQALKDGGTAAFRETVARLTRARAAERAEQQAQGSLLWRTRSGETLADGSAPVAPRQSTTVRRSVPGLATEDQPSPSLWKD